VSKGYVLELMGIAQEGGFIQLCNEVIEYHI
jgi:hypothetical protein